MPDAYCCPLPEGTGAADDTGELNPGVEVTPVPLAVEQPELPAPPAQPK